MKFRIWKFRIWDATKKSFVYYEGIFNEFGDREKELWGSTAQQYTGLNDKDGKEIYEGDIIYWEEPSLHKTFSTEEVKFDRGCYWASIPLYVVAHICSIVGNVFEKEKLSSNNKQT